MKVLLINGSPHSKGCTYTALSYVAESLNKADIDTNIFHIGDNALRGCNGCGACRDKNRCIHKDLVNEALEIMEQSDGLVIGSPVYYASSNGALSSFLDRMFYAGNCFSFKPGASIVSARRAGTTAALDQLNKYFSISGMPIVSSNYWNMVHGNNAAEAVQDIEGVQIMKTLGKNMSWLLKCIQFSAEAGILPPKPEKRIYTNFIR